MVPWWILALGAAGGMALSVLSAAGEAGLARLALAGDHDLADLPARRRRRIAKLLKSADTVVPASAFARVLFQLIAGISLALAAVRWAPGPAAAAGRGWAALGLALAGAAAAASAVALIRPRARASAEPVKALRWAGPWLALFHVLAAPLRPMLRRLAPSGMLLSPEELADLVENVSTTDAIAAEDREMLSSVVELGQTLAREVMVPRTDVVALEADRPLRKAMALFLRSGHSRVPVVGPNGLDDALGVAYLKDTALVLQARPDAADDPITSVMRPAVFVPESKPADDVLRELQTLGTHLALVVDEYGGVAGLVTMEDLLEEIVGELTDEHDPDPPQIESLGDGVIRVPARLELDRLGEAFGLEIDDDDVDTVGGLLAKALGRVPISGAQAEVQGLALTAERIEGRRKQVSTVLVRRLERPVPEDEE
ncbi:MAG: hemolysin family protein [Bifidobacteriaceae bacterium]|jgi:CBS domain containing-hemolysin-like protein|nr:hemolysin family protein [Bifidobacteriaceae bacterium]